MAKNKRRTPQKAKVFKKLFLLCLLALFWKKLVINIEVLPILKNTTLGESYFNQQVIDPLDEWNLIVVNHWHKLPEDYQITLTELENGQMVDIRIYPCLQQMFDAAKEKGIYLVVREGYRTEEEQQQIFAERVERYQAEGYFRHIAEKLAEEYVALPGTSEHQLGLAVDINADITYSTSEEAYEWLFENSYQYGFILRYPEGKEEITGINYEPWHYRYVGTEAALNIYREQICLEEYFN